MCAFISFFEFFWFFFCFRYDITGKNDIQAAIQKALDGLLLKSKTYPTAVFFPRPLVFSHLLFCPASCFSHFVFLPLAMEPEIVFVGMF